jgi:hypothetical protein
MKIDTVIKNIMDDRLEHVFIPYILNKKINNQIENRLEMLY